MQIDDRARKALGARLRRIEGQVRGLQRMLAENRACPEILDQAAAVESAVRAFGKKVTRYHLETCVTNALRSGDEEEAAKTYDEVMDLLFRQR